MILSRMIYLAGFVLYDFILHDFILYDFILENKVAVRKYLRTAAFGLF